MNLISRKIEERNEKIVRGLLKLPPNRRCINCDSLGPQYVCTNFWTFVCTTCSGIHREFTHRVKSISMSKFTTQEVEALQNGGNQRARELYLKGWDFQRQRLPSSSNVDKIREFIKNAYVDKKYISGKISDTPIDSQSPKSHEEHRRASSYHSYSQSPPYDHQYEERRYGKRAPVLTRRPGSERTLHIEKLSSFAYSPTRMSEKANDNRYMSEGSISRHSMHSESSGGDPFRSELMSPSSNSNHGFSSPSAQDSVEWKTGSLMEEEARRDVNKVPRPQRPLSSGSFGSYDRNSVSSYSYNSNSQVLNVPEHNQPVVGHHSDTLAVPSIDKHSCSGRSGTLDLFADQVASPPMASSTVDFFQLPATSISQASTLDQPMTTNPFQSSKTYPHSVDYFGNNSKDLLYLTNVEQASSEIIVSKNEGWATFDIVPVESSLNVTPVNKPHKSDDGSVGNSFSMSPFSEKTHYETLQNDNQIQVHNVAAVSYPPISSPWSDTMHNQAFSGATISQSWSAFDDPMGHTQWDSVPQKVEPHFMMSAPSADSNQFVNSVVTEGLKDDATSGFIPENSLPFSTVYQHSFSELNPDHQPYAINYTNPFDLPYGLDSDTNKEFLNMNSLGAALPSDPIPTAFPDVFADPWPSHYPVETSSTSAIQASIPSPYMAGQSQSSHFKDVSPHSSFASVGGNPFA